VCNYGSTENLEKVTGTNMMKLYRLSKPCVQDSYKKVHIGKNHTALKDYEWEL
jgi:hypothetical protein